VPQRRGGAGAQGCWGAWERGRSGDGVCYPGWMLDNTGKSAYLTK